MYAIIETGSKQYRVKAGDVIEIETPALGENQTVLFDKVLAVGAGDQLQVGTPKLVGATVSAELVEACRGKKLVVFKMRRRKGSRRKRGHRQTLARVRILAINPDQP
jgi:large subunit ribosomal protein L21